MYRRMSRAPKTTRRRREILRLHQQLQGIAADTGEALAHTRDLQAQLYNLAQSVLVAASQLEGMRR